MFDFDRGKRTGLDEVVLSEGKSTAQLIDVFREVTGQTSSILFTRLTADRFGQLPADVRAALDYDPVSRTAMCGGHPRNVPSARVAVVSGGSADVPVASEATRTLEYFGVGALEVYDVGVAGLWRLLNRVEELGRYPVVIAVAGMDAALPTVLGGLVPGIVIAVPTSTGYGVADGGRAALGALLTSCAQGLAVMNIDNGFGAACLAVRCLRQIDRREP